MLEVDPSRGRVEAVLAGRDPSKLAVAAEQERSEVRSARFSPLSY